MYQPAFLCLFKISIITLKHRKNLFAVKIIESTNYLNIPNMRYSEQFKCKEPFLFCQASNTSKTFNILFPIFNNKRINKLLYPSLQSMRRQKGYQSSKTILNNQFQIAITLTLLWQCAMRLIQTANKISWSKKKYFNIDNICRNSTY